jgi:hypothetical protein
VKGFAAAIILLILCFNWFGYNAVICFMQQKSDMQMEAMMDKKSIKESELFEIKIPLHLPYQTSWANYERFDGEVKMDGTIYKYVKRKLTDDTLHLMCIKNIKKMEYENAKSDFYKNTNDISSKNNSQKSASILFKKLMIDSDNFSADLTILSQVALVQKNFISFTDSKITDAHLISPKQPPDGAVV